MKRVRYVYEHKCPPGLCSRIGEKITVYPHCSNGVAHLSRVLCIESGLDLWLVEQVVTDVG